jgi:Regulator of chromosome condensation (RCC1) repeat
MALSLYDGAGVQSDGSLWRVSWWETDGTHGESVPAGVGNWYRKGQKLRQTPITATRIGTDSDWAMTAAGGAHFLALKRDGTLWGWGDNRSGQLAKDVPETSSAPVRLGTDSNWEFIAAFSSGSIAVKRDRSVWKWGQAYPITSRGIGKGYIGGTPQKIAILPAKAECILSSHYSDVFMCEVGTGWGLGQLGEDYLGSGNHFRMITELQKLWDGG